MVSRRTMFVLGVVITSTVVVYLLLEEGMVSSSFIALVTLAMGLIAMTRALGQLGSESD